MARAIGIALALSLFISGSALAVQTHLAGDHVLVQPTKSSIVIPDVSGRVKTGLVRGTGPRVLDVKAGDEVLFGKYSGTELKIGGEERIILSESEILAIFP